MKIKRLELKAFGPFSGQFLDFSSSFPALHIVYGLNEAGKSSAMRALQALFFGFPQRTGDNFIHQNQQLLVGGCLEGADGHEHTFFRRKRSVKDLFDQFDNPIEPSALTPFLHGIEKELFLALYGINHETLVMGGQGILDQQGEVGKALFAAGAGLASLKPVIDELEQEGDSLFTPKSSVRTINEALAHHRELLRQSKEATLSGREWEEHQQALDEALKTLAEKQKKKQQLSTEKSRLERLQQAMPDLSDRINLLQQLAELGDVTLLPLDFSERRATLEQREREARINHEQVTARLQVIREKMGGLSLNKPLLDETVVIDELYQRLGEYRKAKSDRPLREGQRISARTAAADLLRQIKPELSINDSESLRPGLSKRRTVQDLASRHEALLLGNRNALLQLQDIEKALERLDAERNKLPTVAETGFLSRAFLAAERAGDIDTQITGLEQKRQIGERECLMALDRLGLWKGSLEHVLHLPLPLTETVNLFDEEFRALTDHKRQIKIERETLEKQHAESIEKIRKLVFAADVPSEEELGKNRGLREQGWQLLRRQWINHEDVAEEGRSYDSRHPLPEAYERMVALADQTADRLYREAELVEKHASLKAEVGKIEQRLTALLEKEATANEAHLEFQRRWLELWASCGVAPLSPREMNAWLGSFEHLRLQVREF
ncbi:MAG: AAA family ATPase, partial [Chlorobiaceae bacterium]|nr:AAA family ATPase [Chlorobiaceae bacterium]